MSFDLTTFVFELVNFALLVLLLRWIAYKPLRRAIAQRRAAIAAEEQRLADALAAAETRQRALDAGLAELRALAEAERAKAIEEGATERARIIAQAKVDAEAERARARTMVEHERQAAEIWVREATVEQGAALAGKLLVDLAPAHARSVLLQRLLDAIARRASQLREGLATGDSAELASPHAPDSGELDAIRAALASALGRAPEIVVREQSTLVAGWVLRLGPHVLDASVEGRLQLVQERARALLGEVGHV
ncbi:MAG: F0F1 ATP synthase subunit delta [Deltaproteobacteria bacterium]|nr:F0F1 ATP synthase subunit delta [Deltaproteobacteria bacterium]